MSYFCNCFLHQGYCGFAGMCLSVCKIIQKVIDRLFFGGIFRKCWQCQDRLFDFSGDPVHHPDPGHIYQIFSYHCNQ